MTDWATSNAATCDGKKGFLSWKQATEHNNRMFKAGSALIHKGKKIEKLEPYRCLKCRLIHLGHPPRHRRLRKYDRSDRRKEARQK